MRYNKFPEIFPCYKIVAHNGNISGYSGDGWVEAKIKKLQNDGVEVLNGKVDEKYFWK
jgi:O6-methylguanine-DNA--protein-cysteine methyltransferase